jgi:transcriptional regulator with XRE-family HTH domain
MTNQIRHARRQHGWSQARLVHEIEKYADHHGLDVATTASLRVYVSEWENGRRPISAEYAKILRAVFGLTDDELMAPTPSDAFADGYAELVQRIELAHAVSRTMVDVLTGQTELLRTMDRQIGASGLVDQMGSHLGRLEDTLAFAVLPDARRPVARALAEAASMAAWQALDVGAADRAWRYYELAKSAAREADDPLYLSHSMGEQAFVLADAGRMNLAVEVIQEAQRCGGSRVSPRLASWLAATEAELLALAGDVSGCRRALDRAMALIPSGRAARDADLPNVFLNASHLTRWRGHSLALTGDESAVGELQAALEAMDPTFVRARAGVHCDLAQAHRVRGERDESVRHLREAKLLANRTGSVRYRRRVERLTRAG